MVKKLAPLSMLLCATILHSTLSMNNAGQVRACGSNLANLLREVCVRLGGYREPIYLKRNSEVQSEDTDLFTFQPIDAYNYVLRQVRSGGVASECCHRSCTLSTLESYCGNK